MLFNSQQLARGWQKTKRVIGDTFNHAVRIGQGLDHGMRIGKKLLASVSPILDQYGGGHHVKSIMSGITAYDSGKADVMHGYNNIQSHYSRIQRQVPEINL
jgi:hypothetical protein